MTHENHSPLDRAVPQGAIERQGPAPARWSGATGGAGAAPRALRKEVLPELKIADVPLEDLRSPARKVRTLDPAHVREVAAAISALGFCVPSSIGKNNADRRRGRLRGGEALGARSAPCIRIEHLPRMSNVCSGSRSTGSAERANGTSTSSRSNSRI